MPLLSLFMPGLPLYMMVTAEGGGGWSSCSRRRSTGDLEADSFLGEEGPAAAATAPLLHAAHSDLLRQRPQKEKPHPLHPFSRLRSPKAVAQL